MLGWTAAQEGNVDTGIRQMHESAEALQKQNANLWVPQTLLLEAEILGNAKQYQHAHKLLDDAQALIEPLDQRFYEAELHRVRGAVLTAEKADSSDGLRSLIARSTSRNDRTHAFSNCARASARPEYGAIVGCVTTRVKSWHQFIAGSLKD
jgi:predicted ATPase